MRKRKGREVSNLSKPPRSRGVEQVFRYLEPVLRPKLFPLFLWASLKSSGHLFPPFLPPHPHPVRQDRQSSCCLPSRRVKRASWRLGRSCYVDKANVLSVRKRGRWYFLRIQTGHSVLRWFCTVTDIENTLNFPFKKCLRPGLFQSCKNQYQFGKVITALPIPVNIKNANS